MTETAHTPGPWSFKVDARTGDCGIVADGTGVFVEAYAEIRHAGENARAEALANARLVSSAPDLLEALILLEREMVLSGNAESVDYGWKPAILKTRAAISKAEGRS